ncbi:hypothetical protein GCM10028862_02960 [Luteimonas pelagia]
MARFRIVVVGTGMSVPPDGIAGFVTTRFVTASSPELAAQEALRLVEATAAAEPAFQSSPPPVLSVDLVSRVWSPFKRSPNSGYSFFGPEDGPDSVLDIERAVGSGWW